MAEPAIGIPAYTFSSQQARQTPSAMNFTPSSPSFPPTCSHHCQLSCIRHLDMTTQCMCTAFHITACGGCQNPRMPKSCARDVAREDIDHLMHSSPCCCHCKRPLNCQGSGQRGCSFTRRFLLLIAITKLAQILAYSTSNACHLASSLTCCCSSACEAMAAKTMRCPFQRGCAASSSGKWGKGTARNQ